MRWNCSKFTIQHKTIKLTKNLKTNYTFLNQRDRVKNIFPLEVNLKSVEDFEILISIVHKSSDIRQTGGQFVFSLSGDTNMVPLHLR